MRPIALTIEGLTSFREPQAIDFSDLDLFVITGPTGAGKSSILDAITLALYGNVPRVNSHELRDLISHGSSYMRVSLDFEVGGQYYRVARRLGRNSHDVTLELVGNGTAAPELERGGVRVVNDRLEEIIGLDFNAFTKAVLLPQGAFADFLKGDPRERRRILMRLLDLGRYERAGQAARREATRLQAIIGERENLIESSYQHATAERLRELKAAAKDAWKEYAKVDATSQQAKELVEQTAAASANAKTLSQGVEKLDEVVQRLGELAQAWPPLELEENKATEAVAQAEKTVIDAEKRQAHAQKALEATARKTGDAATLALLEEAAGALTREQAALTRLDEEQAQLRESIQGLEKAQDAAAAAEKAARKTVTESAAGIERAEKEKGLAQALHTCAQRAANATERERECAGAQKAADASRAPAEEARAQLRHLEQEHAAIALRADLSPGDECPVCGETIQAIPASAKDVEKQLAAARKSSADASEGESKAQEALVAAQAQLAAATKELEDAKKLLPAGTAIPSVADATRAARAAEATAANARKAEQNAQKTLEQTAQQLSGVKNELAKTQERANGLIKTRDAANERRSTAEATLSAAFGARLPNDLPAAIGARREQLSAADSAHAAATAELNDSRRTLEAVRETLAGTSQKLARFDSESSAARTAAQLACEGLAEALEEKKLPPFPRDEPARDKLLSASSATCEKYREAAEHAMDRLEHEQQDTLRRLQKLASSIGIEQSPAEPRAVSTALEQALTHAHGTAVAADKDIEALENDICKRKDLEEAIVDDRRLRALHDTLANELQTNHFIAYVLEESMNQLADQASLELLRISDDRYSLVADEGNFEVVDHHNADEHRSVATLSGGETFLASLSLALALSAGLRELATTAAARLDAIFIDEGFGALDPETLDIVVDALERLREGDRMVGVITHVPTMGERIAAGLSVEKSGGSSRILVRS